MPGSGKHIDHMLPVVSVIRSISSGLDNKLPHIEKILKADLNEVLEDGEVIVITNKEDEFKDLSIAEDKIIIDLVRINGLERHGNYHGICW